MPNTERVLAARFYDSDEDVPIVACGARTFELSLDGTQLYETLHLTTGRDSKSVGVRYVYDQVQGTTPDTKK